MLFFFCPTTKEKCMTSRNNPLQPRAAPQMCHLFLSLVWINFWTTNRTLGFKKRNESESSNWATDDYSRSRWLWEMPLYASSQLTKWPSPPQKKEEKKEHPGPVKDPWARMDSPVNFQMRKDGKMTHKGVPSNWTSTPIEKCGGGGERLRLTLIPT